MEEKEDGGKRNGGNCIKMTIKEWDKKIVTDKLE